MPHVPSDVTINGVTISKTPPFRAVTVQRAVATDVVTAGDVIVAVPGEEVVRISVTSPATFYVTAEEKLALEALRPGDAVTVIEGSSDPTQQTAWVNAVVMTPPAFPPVLHNVAAQRAHYGYAFEFAWVSA